MRRWLCGLVAAAVLLGASACGPSTETIKSTAPLPKNRLPMSGKKGG